MAKKIIELLRSGNPSKMFYLGFKKPMSIYEMSKIIYNGKVQPQKLYIWRDRLKEKKYFKKTSSDKWQSTVAPLIEEIQKRLKEKGIKQLSQDYIDFLTNFLDKPFRKIVTLYEPNITNITDSLEYLLTDLELYLILYESTIFRKHPELKTKFRTMKDYKQWIKNIPAMEKKIQKTVFNMTKRQYGYGKMLDINLLPDLFIPYDLIKLLKGISIVGEKYRIFTAYLNETNSLTSKMQ